MRTGKVFKWNKDAFLRKPRLIANKGGTRSSKTYSIIQLLVLIANVGKKRSIDIVSESLPHLKRGAIKDIDDILRDAGLKEGEAYDINRSDHVYTFRATGTTISFFSADNWAKVKGSRRDILFINEANHINYETYRQLAVRTTETIIIDWNPDSEFWYEEHGLNTEPTTIEIKSTYLDNAFLTDAQIAEIERNRERDPQWWRVYGEGEVGLPTGLIYTDHHLVDEIPDRVKRNAMHTMGLDFGFSNDPTALVDVFIDTTACVVWCDERLYRVGMTNRDIANHMKADGISRGIEIFADSAEPKSIAELHQYGFNVKPAYKKDLNTQISWLKGYTINITKQSLNGIKELRNYKWKVDKDGKTVNEPTDLFNHFLDALRYSTFTPVMGKPALSGGTIKIARE
jgi:phage terminase large subunit